MLAVGVDSGSRSIKIVFWDIDSNAICGSGITDQGIDPGRRAETLYRELLDEIGGSTETVARVVSTGYGRQNVMFADTTMTEISCHARGVVHLVPGVRTVIDVGGQDSKVIHLEDGGQVVDFSMNDRCAAGTGRFLEIVSDRLGTDPANLGKLMGKGESAAQINSMCVVFAEAEIVGLLASGASAESIAAGVQRSIATRLASLAGRRVAEPIVMTGGVALIDGMTDHLTWAFDKPVTPSPMPQWTGALGAALIAAEHVQRH